MTLIEPDTLANMVVDAAYAAVKPIVQVSTKAWYLALERAGIEDFRWHDLRHIWASGHVQQGTPLFAVQAMGGWEDGKALRW